MLSFEDAGRILDFAADELPEGVFDNLNGGINLLPDVRRDDDGRYIMGLYHNDTMGRYIEIFYGSFIELYPEISPEEFARELKKTLHHELTHHVENLAGDRTLEKWDEQQKALWESGGTLYADSLLFVDGDDAVLAPAACAMFIKLAAECCPEVKAASAGLDAPAAEAPAEALKAAAAQGADISRHIPQAVSEELLAQYEAVLCMTLEQGDELARRYPRFDEKIMCLGEMDIVPPRLKIGWGGVMRRLKGEIEHLVNELCAEEE